MSRRCMFALTLMIPFCSLAAVFSASDRDSPSPRLLVWDQKNGTLHALDPASGARIGAASVPPGALAATRNGDRLIAFWADRRSEHATILERASLRIIGDVPIGTFCADRLETNDGRYLAVTCWQPESRKGVDNKHLIAIDLASGTLAGRLQIPGESSLLEAGDGRLVLVSRWTASSPANAILAARLPDLNEPVRLELPCAGDIRRELLTDDHRRLFVRCDLDRQYWKRRGAFSSTMMIVDLDTFATPRVVPLGDDVYGSWSFTDRRFIYVGSFGGDFKRDLQPSLVMFSTDTENVTSRVPVSADSDLVRSSLWGQPERLSNDSPFLVLSANSVLAIRDGKISATTDLPGRTVFATLAAGPAHLYVTRDRTLLALDIRSGALAWSASVKGERLLTVSPDGTRALHRNGDDVAVLDLAGGKTIAQFKSSTKGARAGLFWKDFGLSMMSASMGGGNVYSGTRTDVVFSASARRVMLLASTGEVVLADLVDGRIVTRRSDRAAALIALPRSDLGLLLSKSQVVVWDLTSAKEVQTLTFPDAEGDNPYRIAASADRSRVVVGAASTAYVLESTTGRVVARAGDLGKIAGVIFLE